MARSLGQVVLQIADGPDLIDGFAEHGHGAGRPHFGLWSGEVERRVRGPRGVPRVIGRLCLRWLGQGARDLGLGGYPVEFLTGGCRGAGNDVPAGVEILEVLPDLVEPLGRFAVEVAT